MNPPAGGAIHPLIAPVPVRPSVGTVHGGGGRGFKERGDQTVEKTSSEGNDGHWDDLVTEVGLSLRVLAGVTLKQTKDKLSQSVEITGRVGGGEGGYKTCGRVEAE